MKTKSENMKLFKEACDLRETIRSELHNKATNNNQYINNTPSTPGTSIKVHNKSINKDG